jgi:hypothetical protein
MSVTKQLEAAKQAKVKKMVVMVEMSTWGDIEVES